MTKTKDKLKIVSVINTTQGGKLHRVQIPLSHLNGKEIKINNSTHIIETHFIEKNENFEDVLSKADILYNHWELGIPAYKLGILLSKHKVKLIVDIDDIYYLDENHINYKELSPYNLIRQIAISDGVVVATERLKSHIDRFVSERSGDDFKPIHVSPNALPDKGQFVYKPQEKAKGKIAFGLFGSASHLPDYKMLRGAIRILGNNKNFAKKAKFVVAGYVEGNSIWEEIRDIFRGLKTEVEFIHALDTDNYMKALDAINVVLAPLEMNEFNLAKSDLKIRECAMRDIPLIGSLPYSNKDMGCCIAVEPEDWQYWMKLMLENDNYLKIGAELGERNRSLNDFNSRIEGLTIAIGYVANTEYTSPKNLKVYGITYDSLNQYTEFEEYDNNNIKTIEQKSYLFEYNPIIDIIDNKVSDLVDTDYLGIFSYKFPYKTGLSKKLVEKLFLEVSKTEGNYDVLGLASTMFKNNYLEFTEEYHPGFMGLFELVCKDLNLEVKEPKNIVYSNFFLAKKQIYIKFVTEIVKPTIELMETKYKDLAWKDANYIAGLKGDKLKEMTGLEYYPMHVFVLERMLSMWLENNSQITFKQIG